MYQWVKYLHILSALGFVAVHGASIAVLYAARNERDRKRLLAVLDFSGRTATWMYVSMVAVVGSGIWLGVIRHLWLRQRWYWLALILLAAISGLMLWIAKPFTARIRAACELRPSGIPRKSDEELAELLRSPRVHVIAAIGIAGLAAILYLMVFHPTLGAGPGIPSSSPPTTGALSDAELLTLGQTVFEETAGGIGCTACHGMQGEGTAIAPHIAGKNKADIETALASVGAMSFVELTPDELEGVARYMAQLGQ